MAKEVIEGQQVNNSVQMGLSIIPDRINHHVGSTATKFDKPTDRRIEYLILHVEAGNFRLQVGDKTATIGPYAIPISTVSDGSGSLALENGEMYVFTAPNTFTVVGDTPLATLTYSWV